MQAKRYIVILLTILVWGMIPTSGQAQQADADEIVRELRHHLDALSKDVAEEYLDILEGVRDVIEDYEEYMAGQDDDDEHSLKSLSIIRRNLQQRAYIDDPERLFDDLYEAVDQIKAVESRHRVEFDTNSPRCCRLLRTLRKEFIMLAELVEDYIDQHTGANLNRREIGEYIKAALSYLQELDNLEDIEKALADNEEALEALEELEALGLDGILKLEGKGGRYFIYSPEKDIPGYSLPEVPEAPEAPEVPEIEWRTPDTGDRGWFRVSDDIGASRVSNVNIAVNDRSLPIVIENPTGDILIRGGSGDQILAVFSLDVSASSHAKEKKLLDQTELIASEEARRYLVSVDMPRLADVKTGVLRSVLEVTVPYKSQLICSNSYGQVKVEDLTGPIEVRGNNSRISINDVIGDVEVSNRMGSIDVWDVQGEIDLDNSYGPIKLEDCQSSRIAVENEYSHVEVYDCEADLKIANSGQIDIRDHTGDVLIHNMYGVIEIEKVEGSVEVINGYQPIIVSGVSGAAELENSYSEISVEEIGGALSVTNNGGPIYVEALDGPVDLVGMNGNISIVLGPEFRGGSQITSTQGTVKIGFYEEPDLILSLWAENGAISSNLPIDTDRRGDIKRGELVLGEGGKRLEVTGEGSTIIIQGR